MLPLFSTYTAHAIYPNIYVPKHIFDDLKKEVPEPKNVAVLIHEQTHIDRQRKMGWLIWGFRYCFSGTFRFEEELTAITASMKFYKQNNLIWDTNRTANFLSSYLYLWCINKRTAKVKLDEIWEKLEEITK